MASQPFVPPFFEEWIVETTDEDDLRRSDLGETILWVDSGALGSIGYDFVGKNSAFMPSALVGVKYMLLPNVFREDLLWIASFRNPLRVRSSASALRSFRQSAGLDAVFRHVEAWMRNEGTLDVVHDGPYLFQDQTLPDPFSLVYPSSDAPYQVGRHFERPSQGMRLDKGVAYPFYSFDSRIGGDGSVSVFASKYWRTGSQHLEIAAFRNLNALDWSRSFEDGVAFRRAMELVGELEGTHERMGLEAAMQLAESYGVSNDLLNFDRPDSHLFSEGDPDPFISLLQMKIASEGRRGDRTVRVEFRTCTARRQGKSRPAVEAIKHWEGDLYSRSVVLRTFEVIEDADMIVGTLRQLAERDAEGLAEAIDLATRMAIAEGRIDASDPLWRVGPPLLVSNAVTEDATTITDES